MIDSPPARPRAEFDYPRNLVEFGEFFPDEKACVAYLERLRWPEGFVCPKGHVLPYYLDEFTFRFNRRTSKARGLLFYRLVAQAVRTPHVGTDALFRGTGRGRLSRRNASHKR